MSAIASLAQQQIQEIVNSRTRNRRRVFFSRDGFQNQKPYCDQREYLMMVPTCASLYLVIRKTSLTLGSLETTLHAMLSFNDAC